MVAVAERTIAGTEHIHGDWELLQEYPLRPELLSMSRAWRRTDRDETAIAPRLAAKPFGPRTSTSAPSGVPVTDRKPASLWISRS